MSTPNKRERLIDSAAILFHRNGLMATSLADIAKHAEVPIGNVYYYFKTKDELALASTLRRREQFAKLYTLLTENIDDPRERLIEAVNYYSTVREDYTKHGCPIGKIISDTESDKDPVAKAATSIFSDFIEWAETQFRELGHEQDARKYAIHLMAGIQGATVMAKAFADKNIIINETDSLVNWLQSIPNRRIQLGKVFRAG